MTGFLKSKMSELYKKKFGSSKNKNTKYGSGPEGRGGGGGGTNQDLRPAEGGQFDGGEAGAACGSLHGVNALKEGVHVTVAVTLTLV